jgi:hypothetical protein
MRVFSPLRLKSFCAENTSKKSAFCAVVFVAEGRDDTAIGNTYNVHKPYVEKTLISKQLYFNVKV